MGGMRILIFVAMSVRQGEEMECTHTAVSSSLSTDQQSHRQTDRAEAATNAEEEVGIKGNCSLQGNPYCIRKKEV